MTWAKFGTEFADQCAQAALSDAAFRTHYEAIEFLYRVEQTDCRFPRAMLNRIAGSPDRDRAVTELLGAGFWATDGERLVVVHHGDVIRQSLASQHAKRERDKAAQQSYRKKGRVSADASADVAATQTDRQALTDREAPTDWPEVAPVGQWLGTTVRERRKAG